MDRFRWCSHPQIDNEYGEKLLIQCNEIRIYENSTKTSYEKGMLKVTNCRFIWLDERDPQGRSLHLPLLSVISTKVEGGFYSTDKVALNLIKSEALDQAMKGLPSMPNWARNWLDPSLATSTRIQMNSPEDVIKFGFIQGVKFKEVKELIEEYSQKKEWNYTPKLFLSPGLQTRTRVGIADIERSRAAKLNETDTSISKAFEDLDNLMKSAQSMVRISKELSNKLKTRKENGEDLEGSIEELRNELLTMGIVEEESLGLDISVASKHDSFHTKLAKDISNLSLQIIQNKNEKCRGPGGCIDMASVYCRINRARGLDLVSPKDVFRACEMMKKLNLPVVMKKFPSGLVVLHLASENEEETLLATKELVEGSGCLNPAELSRRIKIAPSLAKERLNAAVMSGYLCVDESIEGTFFYPNNFLE